MITARDDRQRDRPRERISAAEQDRDHRVDVRVGRHLRDRRVLEQPRVRRERDQRADHDQVDEGQDGVRIERVRVHLAGLADAPARSRASTTRRSSSAAPSRGTGSDGSVTRDDRNDPVAHDSDASDDEEEPERLGVAAAARQQQQRDAGEPEQHADERATRDTRSPGTRGTARPTAAPPR